MRRPKEPKTFNYPRLYFQIGFYKGYRGRLRIVYPDGTAEFSWALAMKNPWGGTPCWLKYPYRGQLVSTGEKALKLMRRYDKKVGFPAAEFVGEIK